MPRLGLLLEDPPDRSPVATESEGSEMAATAASTAASTVSVGIPTTRCILLPVRELVVALTVLLMG